MHHPTRHARPAHLASRAPSAHSPARLGGLALAVWVGLLPGLGGAAELVVAHVGPFSGPLAENGEQNWIGAKACIAKVNAEGGVNGNTIRLVREDDHYDAAQTQRLVELVAQRDKPLAFINLLGSVNVAKLIEQQTFERLGIAAIGVTPGAEALRKPGSSHIFHLQAGDQQQIEKILAHLSTLGLTRLAVAYQENPFGKSGLGFVRELVGKYQITLKGEAGVPVGADDVSAAAAALQRLQAQVYLMVLAPNSAAALVRDVRRGGDRTLIYGMSYANTEGILKRAGLEDAAGVALSQVLPNATTANTGLARSYQADLLKYAPAGTQPSSLSLTGCLAARTAVEALRRAGPTPTPAAVLTALRGLRSWELGGYTLDFSQGPSSGSSYVDIGVIDRNGRLRY